MTVVYDPYHWYWRINADATKVYSSASGDYVQVSDETYQTWLNSGGAPTDVITEAALGEILATYALRPSNANVLDGYKDSQATKLTIEIVAKVLFNHESRIRVLEGQSTVTAAQFKTALKALM